MIEIDLRPGAVNGAGFEISRYRDCQSCGDSFEFEADELFCEDCQKEEKSKEQIIKLQDLVMFLDGMMRRASKTPLPRLPSYVFEKP